MLDTKTSLLHATWPRIRAHYTKRQLTFQSDSRLMFSSLVHHVCRFLSQNASCEYGLQCTCCLLFLPLRVAVLLCGMHVCTSHTTVLLALGEDPDPLSVLVVRLSRNSYTTRSFIGLLHWVTVATDRIVGLSLMVSWGHKTQRWLVIWYCLTHMENASLCDDQPKGRWASRPSSAMSVSVNRRKITH